MTPLQPKPAATDQDIFDRIFDAILDRRLLPGAHLREVELAVMFGVSRTKVRQALAKLIQGGVVELRPNRGSAVAAPTRAQARQVFDLRAMLEPAIAARCALHHLPADIARLRAHLAVEDDAKARDDEPALIRATGEFHLQLAEMLGNTLLDKMLRDLEALTCLSIASYAHTGNSACLPHEHRSILDAIARGDADTARTSMASHLDHVRQDLDLNEPRKPPSSLSQALGLSQAKAEPKPKRSRRASQV